MSKATLGADDKSAILYVLVLRTVGQLVMFQLPCWTWNHSGRAALESSVLFIACSAAAAVVAAAAAAANKGNQLAPCATKSIFRHQDKWMLIYTICHVSSFVLRNRDVCTEAAEGRRGVMYLLWQA